MMPRIVVLFAAALLLSACSDQDWNYALTFTGLGPHDDQAAQTSASVQPEATPQPARTVQAPPAPEGAQPKPNAFCEAVAAQDAGGNDFDAATQSRMFVQSYRQCVAVFGDAAK